jgi:hypothetical protein
MPIAAAHCIARHATRNLKPATAGYTQRLLAIVVAMGQVHSRMWACASREDALAGIGRCWSALAGIGRHWPTAFRTTSCNACVRAKCKTSPMASHIASSFTPALEPAWLAPSSSLPRDPPCRAAPPLQMRAARCRSSGRGRRRRLQRTGLARKVALLTLKGRWSRERRRPRWQSHCRW